MIEKVIKRDSTIEDFSIEKLSKWGMWASVVGVDYKKLMFETFNRINKPICKTSELHDVFIKTCLDKKDEPHSKMAGRLYLGVVYKRAFGGHDSIPSLVEVYHNLVNLGYWCNMGYSDDELYVINSKIINHDIDKQYTYSQIKQIADKYGVKDKVNNQYFESPQFTFIRVAMACSMDEKNSYVKLQFVESYYKALAIEQSLSAPTPNYSNLGTTNYGLASCCLIKANDTAPSIATAHYIADQMTCASSGIGHHLTSRSKGDGVKNGTIEHKGKLPYYRVLQASIKANVQSSRGGSATTYIICNDPEIYDLIKARSVTTPQEKRVGGIDYAFSHIKEFRKRVANNQDWPLFSYQGNEDLYESMYLKDTSIFEKKLMEYEEKNKQSIVYVNARQLMLSQLKEEYETGRAYEFNIDEVNRHTSFKEPIYQSNLCVEIAQPTKGYDNVNQLFVKEESGEISMCTLAAISVSKLPIDMPKNGEGFSPSIIDEYYNVCYLAARMIDNVIDITHYPFPQLEFTAKNRRNSAIGINGLAHLMAKLNLKYSSMEGRKFLHQLAELHSFCVHKASLQLAKERGVAPWINRTYYVDGWLPIDTYNKNVDSVVDSTLYLPWEELRSEMLAVGGLRFSSHVAMMPCESSSQASNTPNGLYPVRGLVITKTDGEKSVTFIAPDHLTIGKNYEIAWDIDSKRMIEVFAIFQKFTDQPISVDSWIDKDENGKFSGENALDDFLYRSWLGVKTKYYTNTRNNGVEVDLGESCSSGACKM